MSDARRYIGKWLNEQPNSEIDKTALAELCAEFDALKNIWGNGRALQIDSYATGKPQVGIPRIIDGKLHLEITDGAIVWKAAINLPDYW